MNRKNGFWIIGSLIIIILIYTSWLRFGSTNASAEILSKQAAQKLVQDRYQGTITQISLAEQQYHIKLEIEKNLYTIKLDAISGKVLSFTKNGTKTPTTNQPSVTLKTEDEVKKIILAVVKGTITSFEKIISSEQSIYKAVVKEENKQTTLTVDAVTGKILSSTTSTITDSTKRVTEAEAREIAKQQVNGSVDHISLETKGEQTYYLVEVKTEDNREAIVQIHAITGNVMSITWDDHSKDDDNKIDDSKNQSSADKGIDDSKNRSKDDRKEDDD
jgi:uncharacterized membrane protein YkoI